MLVALVSLAVSCLCTSQNKSTCHERAECEGQVVEELLSMAGPGKPHQHTLLLVFGDHGQTLTGDHGGGAPEEVDSALFALNVGAYHQIRQDFSKALACLPPRVSTCCKRCVMGCP